MKKTNKMYRQRRQGDVLLIPVDNIPANLVRTKKVTLALGEVTGHHHTFHSGAVGYAETSDALAQFIELASGATIVHQTHGPISFPKGKYRSVIQSEYTPQAIRNVKD